LVTTGVVAVSAVVTAASEETDRPRVEAFGMWRVT
jgi:hypothetical protein